MYVLTSACSLSKWCVEKCRFWDEQNPEGQGPRGAATEGTMDREEDTNVAPEDVDKRPAKRQRTGEEVCEINVTLSSIIFHLSLSCALSSNIAKVYGNQDKVISASTASQTTSIALVLEIPIPLFLPDRTSSTRTCR